MNLQIDNKVSTLSTMHYLAEQTFTEKVMELEAKQETKKFTWADDSKPASSYDFEPKEHQPLSSLSIHWDTC